MDIKDMRLEDVTNGTNHLSTEELGQLVDHLGYGTLDEARSQSWFQHVEHLLPVEINAADIHELWVTMIFIHGERFRTS
ncbi:MAG: hypothetical protein WC791_04190 [Candidatus Paceibacterota bacterium]|jgi:hypothetical protein